MRRIATIVAAALLAVGVLTATGGAATTSPEWPRKIYVVNQSPVPQYRVRDALPAFQAAVDEDFGPIWDAYATLVLVNSQDEVPDDAWEITLMEETDVWGAAGYHDVTHGIPYAIVGTSYMNWQLVFTHELFEMLADPYIDRTSANINCSNFGVPNCTTEKFYLIEVADPVEAQRWAYIRWSPYGRPIVISDFVTPWYFTGTGGHPMDFKEHIHHAHSILSGGYQYVFVGGRWESIDNFNSGENPWEGDS